MKNKIDSLRAQIIVYSRMRDTIKKVAANYIFNSIQQRDEFYMAILEALEKLEDELEEALNAEEEEKDEKEV